MQLKKIILILISSICINLNSNPLKFLRQYKNQIQRLYKQQQYLKFKYFKQQDRNYGKYGNYGKCINSKFKPSISLAPLITVIKKSTEDDEIDFSNLEESNNFSAEFIIKEFYKTLSFLELKITSTNSAFYNIQQIILRPDDCNYEIIFYGPFFVGHKGRPYIVRYLDNYNQKRLVLEDKNTYHEEVLSKKGFKLSVILIDENDNSHESNFKRIKEFAMISFFLKSIIKNKYFENPIFQELNKKRIEKPTLQINDKIYSQIEILKK